MLNAEISGADVFYPWLPGTTAESTDNDVRKNATEESVGDNLGGRRGRAHFQFGTSVIRFVQVLFQSRPNWSG